jgi:flagellar biosynthesis protein FlhG
MRAANGQPDARIPVGDSEQGGREAAHRVAALHDFAMSSTASM